MSKSGGIFITLEGIDGAGKTSHIASVASVCRAHGYEVVITREPGGTPLGEGLRQMILHEEMDPYTETLLVFAGRREHWVQVIEPALSRGCCVISDRFVHASYAYQGGGRGVPYAFIQHLSYWTHGLSMPDLCFIFDLPLTEQVARLQTTDHKDRFESAQDAFFARVRDTYLRFAQADTAHCCVLSADQLYEEIDQAITTRLTTFFDQQRTHI